MFNMNADFNENFTKKLEEEKAQGGNEKRERKDKIGKRYRESSDEELPLGTHKRGKFSDSRIVIKKENNNAKSKLVSINDLDESVSSGSPKKNSNLSNAKSSTVNYSLLKNDVLNIIWKLVIPKDEILKLKSSTLSYSGMCVTTRKDIWTFNLEINKKGCLLDIFVSNYLTKGQSINYCKIKIPNDVSNNSENEIQIDEPQIQMPLTNKSFLQEVADSVYFDIEGSLNFLYFKNQNFNFSTVRHSQFSNIEKETISDYRIETNLPSEFYTLNYSQAAASTRSNLKEKLPEDSVGIVLEISCRKLFDLDLSQGPAFTGIVNEAATCYMNSMLQTLNIFGMFKKAVFQIPTGEEDFKSNSVSLSLQRLFYDLLRETEPISTNNLVRSFGWGREQISIQHDVQEFNLLLSEVMEKKMKGTPSEGIFSHLFEGKLINYIKCVNVDYTSEKEEKFSDLQLTIKGCKNIYESLNLYTEEEVLDDSNKYQTERYGKQTAKKGIKFSKFPNILMLQLKRFEYNHKKGSMVKINDYFEFFEELDLKRYMDNSSEEKDKSNMYTLHSVVVHHGGANSGHYYALIRPECTNNWVLFNDEIVRPADHYEVFDNNFGGTFTTYKHKNKGEINSSVNYHEHSAYILVYIKQTERQKILSPVSLSQINPSLINYFEKEKFEEKRNKMKKLRIKENMNIILFSNDSVLNNHKNKLGVVNSFMDLNQDEPFFMKKDQRMIINFPKNSTILDFLNFVSDNTGINCDMLKLFKYENFEWTDGFLKNRNLFKLELIKESDYEDCVLNLTSGARKKLVCLYLHVCNENLKIFNSISENKNINLISHRKEEFCVKDKQIVFISKEVNNFSFHSNPSSENSLMIAKPKFDLIIFIKEYNSNSDVLDITTILTLDLNFIKNFKQLEDIFKSSLKLSDMDQDFTFLIEGSDGKQNYNLYLNKNNFSEILSNGSNFFIIIPLTTSKENAILNKLEDLYNIIYLDVFCINRASHVFLKLPINMGSITDENSIKRLLVEEIKNKSAYYKIIDVHNHFYFDQNKNLHELNEEFLNKYFTVDNIEIESRKEYSPKFTTACKEFPLLKYFNHIECRIDFNVNLNFNLESNQSNSETYLQQLNLFDINNNFVCRLTLLLLKKVKRFKEIIEQIYDKILTNKKIHKFEEVLYPENYFFIAENPLSGYIYQIISDSNTEIHKYESKTENMVFRLQPFDNETVDNFQDQKYLKIFVSVIETKTNQIMTKCNDKFLGKFPFVIFLCKTSKIMDLKIKVLECLQNMEFYKEKQNPTIKLSISKIQNQKVIKDVSLDQYRDDDTIDEVFKDMRVSNILIEIS